MQTSISVAEDEIKDYKKLLNFITIFLGSKAIPAFKQQKSAAYLKTLSTFCVREISNAHLSATLWHGVLEISSK